MKYLCAVALLALFVLWGSCRNDFETVASTGNLEFSKDTVYLDTVFTNIGSSTYTLKVYNRSGEDINVPNVQLAQGESSNYRLNVDGLPGKLFEDVRIPAKDSIFIFIETTADIATLPGNDPGFLYTDKLLFDRGGNEQTVDLVTLIQDAVFLFPDRFDDGTIESLNLGTSEEPILIEGFFLDDNQLGFTNEKPYVIYGYAAVPPGKTLTVQAGARIHFHADSGIIVANTGSIQVNGAPSSDPQLLENEVIFEGDRLEPNFSDRPGQWGAIWCTEGSTDNHFTNTTIKNGAVGIIMDSNDGDRTLTLKNVQVYNSALFGVLARTGNVYGENVVVNNSGQASLALSLGGEYEFNHCTFVNYWTNSFRSFPAVQLDNVLQVSDTEFLVADLNARFNNCIVYGNEPRELGFVMSTDAAFHFNFTNSLLRFEDPNGDFLENPLYDFNNAAMYTNTVLNAAPAFQGTAANNFNIEMDTSGADNIGKAGIPPPIDLNGSSRPDPPDAGAYEAVLFPPDS